MATEQDILKALRQAAEKLLGRTLTEPEYQELVKKYGAATGNLQQRALKALGGQTGFTEPQIRTKQASSDDLDRAMRDLEGKLK
jgi:hypothetical protein